MYLNAATKIHRKISALNVVNYIPSYDYRSKLLVIFFKLLFSKEHILKICQKSALNMLKLLYMYAENFSGYEI